MYRTSLCKRWLVAALVLAGLVAARPSEAQTKNARGTAKMVTDVSLTVKVGDKDMTFDVDNKTIVEAPGAGRQTRIAQAAGGSGIKLTNAIQSGQAVQITYREINGKNLATEIKRVSTAGAGGAAMPAAPQSDPGTPK
jgi:hypothetical protein